MVYSRYEGSLRLIATFGKESGVLRSLRVMLDLRDDLLRENGVHLLGGHGDLGYRLETGSADMLGGAGVGFVVLLRDCLLGFDDNWLADDGWHSSGYHMRLREKTLSGIIWLQEHVFLVRILTHANVGFHGWR